jgi:ribosomal protein L37E
VHHKTYKNLGKEALEDLEVLCRRCHDLETFGRTDLREMPTAICESCARRHWNLYSIVCAQCSLLIGLGDSDMHMFDYLGLPDISSGKEVPIWKGLIRTICNMISCGDTGTAEVAKELEAIDRSEVAWKERLRERVAKK